MAIFVVVYAFMLILKNFVEKVIENKEVKDRLYKRICEAYIFKYQAGIDGGIDDVIIDETVIDEEG